MPREDPERPRLEAENQRWEVRVGRDAHEGMLAIVFSCLSNSQEPFRVVEVPAGELPPGRDPATLGAKRLRELFGQASVVGAAPGAAAAASLRRTPR